MENGIILLTSLQISLNFDLLYLKIKQYFFTYQVNLLILIMFCIWNRNVTNSK